MTNSLLPDDTADLDARKFLAEIQRHDLRAAYDEIKKLKARVAELEDDVRRLAKRGGAATIELLTPTDADPFKRTACRIVDFGIADNIYVVESEARVLPDEIFGLLNSFPDFLDNDAAVVGYALIRWWRKSKGA